MVHRGGVPPGRRFQFERRPGISPLGMIPGYSAFGHSSGMGWGVITFGYAPQRSDRQAPPGIENLSHLPGGAWRAEWNRIGGALQVVERHEELLDFGFQGGEAGFLFGAGGGLPQGGVVLQR